MKEQQIQYSGIIEQAISAKKRRIERKRTLVEGLRGVIETNTQDENFMAVFGDKKDAVVNNLSRKYLPTKIPDLKESPSILEKLEYRKKRMQASLNDKGKEERRADLLNKLSSISLGIVSTQQGIAESELVGIEFREIEKLSYKDASLENEYQETVNEVRGYLLEKLGIRLQNPFTKEPKDILEAPKPAGLSGLEELPEGDSNDLESTNFLEAQVPENRLELDPEIQVLVTAVLSLPKNALMSDYLSRVLTPEVISWLGIKSSENIDRVASQLKEQEKDDFIYKSLEKEPEINRVDVVEKHLDQIQTLLETDLELYISCADGVTDAREELLYFIESLHNSGKLDVIKKLIKNPDNPKQVVLDEYFKVSLTPKDSAVILSSLYSAFPESVAALYNVVLPDFAEVAELASEATVITKKEKIQLAEKIKRIGVLLQNREVYNSFKRIIGGEVQGFLSVLENNHSQIDLFYEVLKDPNCMSIEGTIENSVTEEVTMQRRVRLFESPWISKMEQADPEIRIKVRECLETVESTAPGISKFSTPQISRLFRTPRQNKVIKAEFVNMSQEREYVKPERGNDHHPNFTVPEVVTLLYIRENINLNFDNNLLAGLSMIILEEQEAIRQEKLIQEQQG